MCLSGWGGRGRRQCLSRRELRGRGEVVGCGLLLGGWWGVGNIVHWCFACWKEGFCWGGEPGTGRLSMLK